MKTITLMVLFLLSMGAVLAAPVKITANGEAYASHGACEGWNECRNAQGCALAACQANGFNKVVYYGDALPCTAFNDCNYFDGINTSIIDCDYNITGCAAMGVTDIWCDEGNFTGALCSAVLPDQSNPPGRGGHGNNDESTLTEVGIETNSAMSLRAASIAEIPEFGVIAAGVALIGALAIFAIKRKD